MKKLLLLTGSDQFVVQAHGQMLRSLFMNEEDVLCFSPQEASILNDMTGKVPYNVGFYLTISNYEKQKELVFEKLKSLNAIIVFGTVGKNTLSEYDAVVGTGFTYKNGELIMKDINVDLPKNETGTNVKATTPKDAPVIFFDLKELQYLLRKFVDVARKENNDTVQ